MGDELYILIKGCRLRSRGELIAFPRVSLL